MNPFSVLDDSDDEAPSAKPKVVTASGGGAKKAPSTTNNKKGSSISVMLLVKIVCVKLLSILIASTPVRSLIEMLFPMAFFSYIANNSSSSHFLSSMHSFQETPRKILYQRWQ